MIKVSFLTDKEIEIFAESQTIKKVVDKKYIGEVNLLKIGIEFGAKWMRDQIKQEVAHTKKVELGTLAKTIEEKLDRKAEVSLQFCRIGKKTKNGR